MIDINTKFITLVGCPLGQSFAARMQNAAYKAAGLNLRYFYTEADCSHLGEIIDAVRYMPSFAGAAITKPNKVKVIDYLDRLDPLCEKIGACNTVVKTPEGELVGYNTDAIGFRVSITGEGGVSIGGNTFFCFGAGGAGRAICSVLADSGAKKIYICDIDRKSGAALSSDINLRFAPVAEAVLPGDISKFEGCAAVINASGVGMGGTLGQSPMPSGEYRQKTLYFDACYNPTKTRFLLNAEEAGGRVQNGLGMSLWQGAAQIELWTGQKAPVERMRQELKEIVAGR